ncbi:MAG: gamma-glutamyltransferase [Polyangiaceae bacterium]
MKRLVLACVLAFGCANPSAPVPTDPVAPSATSAPPPAPAPSASSAASLPPPPDPPSAAEEPENVVPPVLAGAGKKSTAGPAGVVVSVDPEASRVGAKILEAGGNAVDAAVAVAFVLAVTHPSAGNLGGGGFLLVRPRGGPTSALDFRETAPAKLTRELFDRMIGADGSGALSVGVPGTVRGLGSPCIASSASAVGKTSSSPARCLVERGHRGAREAATLSLELKEANEEPRCPRRVRQGGKPYREKDGDRAQRPGAGLGPHRRACRVTRARTGAAIAKAVNAGRRSPRRERSARLPGQVPPAAGALSRPHRRNLLPPPSAGGVALQEILGILARSAAPSGKRSKRR